MIRQTFASKLSRVSTTVLILSTALLAALLSAKPAQAVSTSMVISQVYGAGGFAATALYKNDYIELFNRGTASVDIANWSVQYASVFGNFSLKFNLPAVSTMVQPGQYFLIQGASSGTNGADLPTPDAISTLNLSFKNAKIALVNNQTLLTCGATNNCFPNPAIIDFVGYGTASTAYEGNGPTPDLSDPAAAVRLSGGCVDTDNNNADFSVTAGTAHNHNTTAPCSALPTNTLTLTSTTTLTPSNTPTGTLVSTNTPTLTPTSSATLTLTMTNTTTPAAAARIYQIQATSHISPLNTQSVSNVPGIVTGLRTNGFYLQDPNPDADPSTSEGIFVFTSSAPTIAVGDAVQVSGKVSEFRSGGASGVGNLTTTEIVSPLTITPISSGNALPAPIIIGIGGRIPPNQIIEDDAGSDVETGTNIFDPASDGIDFYESLEGMRVQVNNAVVVGPTKVFGANNNEITVVADNGANAGPRTVRGGVNLTETDANPERIILGSPLYGGSLPALNVGDTFTASIVGIMDYSFGNFKLNVTAPVTTVSGGLTPEVTTPQTTDQLSVATFNVQNLAPTDLQAKYNALGSQVVNNLKSPDVITVEEIQDNSGATDDGIVAADQTFAKLIGAIVTAGGPTYQYRQINPVNDQDGGQPGGNIRQGFLFNPARVSFTDRGSCGSTDSTSVITVGGQPQLTCSPGRIDPTNSAWSSSRKPLAGEFVFNGNTVFVIGNHFNSKGGDNPLFGHAQPPVQSSRTQRLQQATIVHDFVNTLVTANTNANIVVLGDLNDFQFSPPLLTLAGTILDNLMLSLPLNEQYSYVFEGNSQVLDQILVSHHLTNAAAPQYDVVHINAEFAVQTSDHDPSVVRLNLPTPPVGTATSTLTNTPTATAEGTVINTATSTLTATTSSITLTATFSSTPTVTATTTGTPRPQTAGVFAGGVFYLRNANSAGPADISAVFGSAAMLPVASDWNGDGIDSIGVYDSTTGVFYLSDSNTVPAVSYQFVLGNPGDTPIAGKWDNTMTHAGVGVFRPASGLIYLKRGLGTGFADYALVLGNPGDAAIAGDWDGNGFASVGVFRPSNATFYLSNTVANGIVFGDLSLVFGTSGSKPVAGDWTGNGQSRVGVFISSTFYLRNSFTTGPADTAFVFGSANGLPIAGRWAPATPPTPSPTATLTASVTPTVQLTATASPTWTPGGFD